VSDNNFSIGTSNGTNHTDIPGTDSLPPYVPDPILPPITEPIKVTPGEDKPSEGQYLHIIHNPICPIHIVNNDPNEDPPVDELPEEI
jgi:hypothetical protein